MDIESRQGGTRRITGVLFIVGTVAFGVAATALNRPADAALRVATCLGATSMVLSLVGFLRWVFVVPPLADSYVAGDATTRTAVAAAWMAQHQYGGALLGEHLGQLLVIAWSGRRPSPPRLCPPRPAQRDLTRRARRSRGTVNDHSRTNSP